MGTFLPNVKRTEGQRPFQGRSCRPARWCFEETVAPALHARRWQATEQSTTAVLYETRIKHGLSGSEVMILLGQLVGQ